MPADPAAVKSVFLEAVELPVADRAAFLAERCGADADLLARVSALLAAHDSAGEGAGTMSFADAASTADRPGKDEHVGAVLAGRYKLIEAIGEGGMGAVYLAQQTEPVRRAVAVKVIKAGMDTKAVLARFEAERQALALMDHPNIAKVLDAGTTEGGRPFFVMELVKGVPITKFCDERKLTPRQRLELFVPVCQAIQHAHQKGVIHRDIKPSNVLVALYDDRPVPKVIDFGVAKAAGQTLTDKTLMTGFGAVVGTPEYMSPEQASLNNLDVDTRSDVYSLGVLLYELLTGSTPVDRKSLGKAALMEVLRIVREVEAPKPSAKLSTIDTLPSVAANRGTEPAKLSRLMKGELDWLVLKALEKDRTRRYETANGLAADVLRYLAGEPVQAVPPSTGYRLKKFVRKNRGPVAAAALVLLALLLGMAGTTFGLVRADERRREAEQARAREAERADGERRAKEAEAERADGERRAKEAEAAQRAQAERATAAERAAKEEAVAAQARAVAAAEAEKVAKRKAVEFRDKALDALRATTGEDVEQLIGSKPALGTSETAYLEAIVKRWQAFATQEGGDESSRAIRAEGHHRVGRLWQKLGRPGEARPECEKAVALREKLAADFPAVPQYRTELAASHSDLGNLFSMEERLKEAEEQHRKGLALLEGLVAEFPAEPAHRSHLATDHFNLGRLLMKVGRAKEAEESLRKGVVLWEKLAAEFPAAPDHREDLAKSYIGLGALMRDLGRVQEAEVQYRKSLALWEKLATDFPAAPAYRSGQASSHGHLGGVLNQTGRAKEAEEQYRKGLVIRGKLVTDFPAVPVYRSNLAQGHSNLGVLLGETGRAKEAEELHRQGLALWGKLVTDFPAVPEYRSGLARSHDSLGVLFHDLGRAKEAEEQYRGGVALLERLATDFPAVLPYRVDLGVTYCRLGLLAIQGGKPAVSRGWFDHAVRTLTPVVERPPAPHRARQFLLYSHWVRADAHDKLGEYAEAAADWARAAELSPPQERPQVRVAWALSRAHAGQVGEAVAEAAGLRELPGWTAERLYQLARVYAVASGQSADKKGEYAEQAMVLLQKALKGGHKDHAEMRQNADLDPLRDRGDFKKLLADLEAKFPPKREVLPTPRKEK
jgi:serine/threonine protein kinase/tetratricopeptide (TPR) repeat protein